MHIPSERVSREMCAESASIWFVPTEGTDTHAILLKCQTNVLKALVRKCPLELIFGIREFKGNKILCTAAKIYDDLLSPFIPSGVQRFYEEHLALVEILQRKSTPIFLFDELNRCVAWAEIKLNYEQSKSALNLIAPSESIYSGDFNEETSHALDCFDHNIDPSRFFKEAVLIDIVTVEISFSEFHTLDIFAYSINESFGFNIHESNEGEGLEQSAWHLLESIFPFGIYKSPQVEDGNTYRELTDILCLSDKGIFLFESKAMAVLTTNESRPMERKVANIQKQVLKAIKQLKGSIKI